MDKTDFYSISVRANDGQELIMSKFKGKKLMIINIASACGYTPQLAALQELYSHYSNSDFEILAFPSNDFGGQEPLDDDGIAAFCSSNYGVSFHIFGKTHVVGEHANRVFTWLASRGAIPEWNFTKFLVDETGQFCFSVAASELPTCEQILNWIKE